jgi:hypothetical protein
MNSIELIRSKYKALSPLLNERAKRSWAAIEAKNLGFGGVAIVHKATGMARSTINAGLTELKTGKAISEDKSRIRRSGGGRKKIIDLDPCIKTALEKILDDNTRGDPMSPLKWTCKSLRNLAEELNQQKYKISFRTIGTLLQEMEYSQQANAKTKERRSDPDRNAQFEFINALVKSFQSAGSPVISVDAKKKESIGDFRNSGQEWRKKGNPEKVQSHDFPYKELGKVTPYGVYDVNGNSGWVSVGTDHDTAEFAVQTIHNWWKKMGSKSYPQSTELLITCDSGGSNSSKSKLWKRELSAFSKATGLKISVSHLPPGTSKWNKIEHRMFSFITKNWRGRPLYSHQTVVNLIGNTTTRTGLKIKSGLDLGQYDTGIDVSDDELSKIKIITNKFHGEWNYTILP